ncbi:MAG: GIY-YIG nuclease family protein [Micropepsaceae bacterium]
MRDQILIEIKRLAKANGGQPLGMRAFERQTGIGEAVWRGRYWARWGDALNEAGFAANEFQAKHATDFVLQKFVDACRHFSRIPTVDELRMYGRSQLDFPSSKALYSHFGTKRALIDNLRAWAKGREGYEDIIGMAGAASEPNEQTVSKEGLVYLIKSGAHYKIGRSDELERRIKEIRIALPEAATLVHSIRTDDPAGIEAYWHRRFAVRRANGEWFKLTNTDVAAFKRRKYQ